MALAFRLARALRMARSSAHETTGHPFASVTMV
jgi:hypothetical protein